MEMHVTVEIMIESERYRCFKLELVAPNLQRDKAIDIFEEKPCEKGKILTLHLNIKYVFPQNKLHHITVNK